VIPIQFELGARKRLVGEIAGKSLFGIRNACDEALDHSGMPQTEGSCSKPLDASELYQKKCDVVYQLFFDSYSGQDKRPYEKLE
jgi:hypothetical protein